MKINKKGFTLIELLVVVLIIGILAAIALPQYQLAVDKAEFTKYKSIAESLRNAYDHYVLIYGEGTKNFDDLSVSLPDNFTNSYTSLVYNCVSNDDMFCCMSSYSSTVQYSGKIQCGKKDLSVIYGSGFYNENGEKLYDRTCRCAPNNTRARRLCSAMGSHYTNNSVVWTTDGIKSNYIGFSINN